MTVRKTVRSTAVALALALTACSGDGGSNGGGGSNGAAGSSGAAGAAGGGLAGGPGCDVGTIDGACASAPTASGSYRCAESEVDSAGPCTAMGMTWMVGGACPAGALYCCTSAAGSTATCFYGQWSDWDGSEAAAMSACAAAHGSWCPR